MLEPAALFARKKMNNDDDDDDDTIDDVKDDRLLSCRSSGGDNDTVFSSAFYCPSTFSQKSSFQADISSKRYHFVNRCGTSEVIYPECRIYSAFFVTVPPDGVELVCREICSPPSILLR